MTAPDSSVTGSSKLPLWVRLADAATLVLLAASAFVALTGGIRLDVLGTKVVVLSAERHFLRAVVIAAIRHLVYRRPSLLARRVRPETRERIVAAAQELGYRPNLLARAVITGRSQLLGVLIPGHDFSYMPRLLEAIQR